MTDSYQWSKLFHEFADDVKFLRIADITGASLELVQACWARALCRASSHPDRGSTAGIDFDEFAWWFKKPIELIRAIFEAFELVGRMIKDGRLANWTKRQGAAVANLVKPVSAGATRQRRYRARKATAELQPELPGLGSVTESVRHVTSGVTEGVTVTPDSESDQIKKRGSAPLNPPLAGGEDAMGPRLLIDNTGGKDGRGPRGSRLPTDWQPDPDDRFFAAKLGLDPDDTAAEFRDYWCPKSRARSLDWSAEWRTHCRRKCERQRPRPGRRSPHQTLFDAARSLAARYERAKHLSGGEPVDLDPGYGMATATG